MAKHEGGRTHNRVGGAGIIILIHRSVVPIFTLIIKYLNRNGRVSDEVLSLHLVRPTMIAVGKLAESLKQDPALKYVENISKLRPNNGVKDLLSGRRLSKDQVENHMLLVSVETVTNAFRKKYPNPNITLQAGSVEDRESVMCAGIRELHEEARILVESDIVSTAPLKLLGGGLFMYVCYIDRRTEVKIHKNSIQLLRNNIRWPRGLTV
jgi:hypothetical protein